jgi:glycosyltransferase involved in cell wall biosynthesis
MTPMHIAIVAPPWYETPPRGYGGIERVCFHLAQGLSERGHDITLVGAGSTKADAAFIPTFPKPTAEMDQTGSAMPEIIHAARSARALDGLDVDVIHEHSLAGPLTAVGSAVPTILTAHGPTTGEFEAYYRALSSEIGLVAISDAQRHQAPDLPWVATVHNALDLKEHPFSEKKGDYVAFVGRMSADKGVGLAIDAARAAGRRLVMAAKCSDDKEREYCEAEVMPRLAEDVEWVEDADTDRTKQILRDAYCTLFPIRWEEPFGMVMIESMACGTPVVALQGGSVPEVVDEGVTGFIRDDPAELPNAIALAGELDRRACRERVARLFDVPMMVSRYEKVYSDRIRSAEVGVDR